MRCRVDNCTDRGRIVEVMYKLGLVSKIN